ncbi:MAG: helical backbone metal receptor [Acidobacteriota bacterium]
MVTAQQVPQRIISIVPSVTEMLFAMGAGSRVVAVSSYDHFPPEVERLARIGALLDPDVERILALRPDLVVTYGSQADLTTQLQRAGIATYAYRHGTLADIGATMRELGARIGLDSAGSLAADRLDRQLEAVRERVRGLRRPRAMLVIGREPGSLRAVQVSGGYGFLHDLIECAGGANVFADVKRESLDVTTETILARAPEVIIELHYSNRPAEAVVAAEGEPWHSLSAVPAIRDGRVVLLYGGELVVPGPRVARTASLFANALHPEARHPLPESPTGDGTSGKPSRATSRGTPLSPEKCYFFGSATR